MRKLSVLVLIGCAGLLAYQPSERPDLSGTWRLESSSGQDESWKIEQKADEVRILRLNSAGKATTEITCGTKGVECPAKIDGDKAKVSYYFNGAALVELVWKGKDVTKTRRSLSPDGSKLMVEVMPMSPPGSAEKLTFVKVPEVATR